MSNFQVIFDFPWLMLLLIPALLLVLIPYFRINKRYRRTRNRVVSIVLHTIVMVLSICVLAGMTFEYDIPNTNNEIILLVDVSHSSEKSEEKRDALVADIIDLSDGMFKMGVVTFGYNQVYAVPMSNDTAGMYEEYVTSLEYDSPDTSATDIASALVFAADQFQNPATAKIVLITDGVETDSSAKNIIKSIASKGIKVDTAYVTEEEVNNELRLAQVTLPDTNLKMNELYDITVSVQGSYEGTAVVTLDDIDADGNVVEGEPQEIQFTPESTKEPLVLTFSHSFLSRGVHELVVKVVSSDMRDTLAQNNLYSTYVYLEEFNNILVVTEEMGSTNISEFLSSQEVMGVKYEVTTVDINSTPTTLDQLRAYDQVVLSGVTNRTMQSCGFDVILEKYVGEIGGSLLTVGSDNAYAYDQMFYQDTETGSILSTTYQKMLPLQAVKDYTPPLAVVLIVDRSGSMSSDFGGQKKLTLAKDACASVVNYVLTERDYCGIMTLESNYSTELKITSCTRKDDIIQAVNDIGDATGGTVFSGALQRAGNALMSLSTVERKHIVLITDGQPSDKLDDGKGGGYGQYIKHFYEQGITLSVIGIQMPASNIDTMWEACKLAGGEEAGSAVHNVEDSDDSVTQALMKDLTADAIQGIVSGEDVPLKLDEANTYSRMLYNNQITDADIPHITGYYGMKLKKGATAVVMGASCPIYAEHKYGNGMVGSIATNFDYASDFFNSSAGSLFLQYAVNNLFPTKNIRAHDIEMYVSRENYTAKISVDTQLAEGETLKVSIAPPAGNEVVFTRDALNYSRLNFSVADEAFNNTSGSYAGLYVITATKYDSLENVVSTNTTYMTFSYSEEYNTFADVSDREEFLATLAANGKGVAIEETEEVFNDFDVILHRTFDPRLAFIITAVILFLLDVAVRKFKFKWIHELVRESKEKKAKQAAAPKYGRRA